MKTNKCFIVKKIVLIFIIFISITTFFGCSKGKSIVLQDDVKKINKSFEGNIKVNEKFIYTDEIKKGSIFSPSFWKNDKLFGRLSYDSNKKEKLGLETKKYISKYFHALDVNKKVLKKTQNKTFGAHYDLKEIVPLPLEDGSLNCNLYYNDFSKEKSQHIFLGKLNDSDESGNNGGGGICMVDGNDQFATTYTYNCDKKIGGIKLIDLRSRKSYKNNNIENIEIIKVLYVKDLKKFMAIDRKGTCYEIMFKGNSLELKEFSKIDTGDLTLQYPLNGVLGICDDSAIYYMCSNGIGKNKLIKNRLIKYDFKTKKTDFILNTDEKDKTRVLMYFPKQNILILEKPDISKDGLEKKGPSEIYLAEIKGGKVNIFYKSKYKSEEKKCSHELFEKLGNNIKNKNCRKRNDINIVPFINEKGNKLAITRNIEIIDENIPKIIERQVIDYYDIKRD
ncbi:hypothetical protein [Clostridium oceanicum]|uniref:Lipoprotein n=1 Tax=Clostridium oceanicum TaxID=1543 RepID=A0ABP3UNN2_9CLOT